MPSPVGFPKHPLPANAPRAAHVLHSMRPELVNLLVMSYFSRGVQAEHLVRGLGCVEGQGCVDG